MLHKILTQKNIIYVNLIKRLLNSSNQTCAMPQRNVKMLQFEKFIIFIITNLKSRESASHVLGCACGIMDS